MAVERLTIEHQIEALDRYIQRTESDDFMHFLLEKGFYRIMRYAKRLHGVLGEKPTMNHLRGYYEFDRNLRVLVFPYIKNIEIRFRNSMSLTLTQSEPNEGTEYLTERIYTKSKSESIPYKKKRALERFPAFLEDIIKKEHDIRSDSKKYPDLDSFRSSGKYSGSKIPIWIFMEFVDFGTIICMYEYLQGSHRKMILDKYLGFEKPSKGSTDIVDDWLNAIRGLRNRAAHHNRIVDMSGTIIHQYPESNSEIVISSSTDLFSRIYAMMKLMTKKEVEQFRIELKSIIETLNLVGLDPIQTKIFPSNWLSVIDAVNPVCEEGKHDL